VFRNLRLSVRYPSSSSRCHEPELEIARALEVRRMKYSLKPSFLMSQVKIGTGPTPVSKLAMIAI
jgi:hypothetical protein